MHRDERTVRRWEKTLGLPVRRVPGGRGSSVFAYVSEVEAWLQRTSTEPEAENARTTANQSAPLPVAAGGLPVLVPAPRAALHGWWIAGATVAVILAVLAWYKLPGAASSQLTFKVTSAGIVALDAAGVERWRYPFPADDQVFFPEEAASVAPNDGHAGVVVAVGNHRKVGDDVNLGGKLLRIGPDGRLVTSVPLDDRVTFVKERFDPPWDLVNFRLDERQGPRVAIAVHHDVWWPGLVSVFDDHLVRRSTFVNAGWLEAVRWASPDRLIVAGFSNAHDGGVVALLDAGAMNGQSPTASDSPFHCQSCGSDAPLRYIVLPRSELNRVTGSSFNRARLLVTADRVLVRTVEVVEADKTLVDILYEFSLSLDLLKAAYSDRYWDMHEALEAKGSIGHGRVKCPDRDGPPAIRVWERATGWRDVRKPNQ